MKSSIANTAAKNQSESRCCIVNGGEMVLSGRALADFVLAVIGKGVRFRFKAKGSSMTPLIKDGDVITVSPLSNHTPGAGDVVAFLHSGRRRLTVHRVVEKRGEYFLVKGDNARAADDLIPKSNILGQVTRVERNGKEVLLGLGPERFFLAFLTRLGLLSPLMSSMRRVAPNFVKRMVL